MRYNYIDYDRISVFDNDVFTKQRAVKWRNHLLDCYKYVLEQIFDQLDLSCPIKFFISNALLEETLDDAIIGMKKIVGSDNNKIENPNTFKVAAYISYWWLRHKPISFIYPNDFDFNKSLKSKADNNSDNEKLVWRIKHINEIVAVNFVLTFIFRMDKEEICSVKVCKSIQKHDDKSFNFDSFEQMKTVMIEKLTYYFCYRAIAPKVIEHILEGYTFHPAWELTGAHWGK